MVTLLSEHIDIFEQCFFRKKPVGIGYPNFKGIIICEPTLLIFTKLDFLVGWLASSLVPMHILTVW